MSGVFGMKNGVIGLGSIGHGIASSLLRAGHGVHGADVNVAAIAKVYARNAGLKLPGSDKG